MNDQNKDIINYIESIPYGNVSINAERVNRKTVKVTTIGEETLRYVDNGECLADLKSMVEGLIESGYTGDTHVKLTLKDGQIKLLHIFNKKETHYQG